MMEELQSMGIPPNASRRALVASKNSVDDAVAWAFSHLHDENYDAPLGNDEFMELLPPTAGAPAGITATTRRVEPDPAIVVILGDMGFSKNGSERAAVATKNASSEAAMDWALSHSGDPDFDLPPLLPTTPPMMAGTVSEDPFQAVGGMAKGVAATSDPFASLPQPMISLNSSQSSSRAAAAAASVPEGGGGALRLNIQAFLDHAQN
mmetsp:Transcript_15732/g.21183  ORF Transcript_15732/g.21183 Transcript_15732/m.21183 type:complete len:207 (-) Transcript_15732:256-876(-)